MYFNDAVNVVLCYTAKRYHVPRTIGRIINPRHAWLFTDKMHVDVALNRSSILAHLIQEEMSLGDMMMLLKLRQGQYSLVEVVIPPGAKVVGKRIMDIPLPEKVCDSLNFRKGETILPRGATVLEVGDEVLVTTDAAGEEQ
jgi:trk system potassium uptake protein TrkA